jgi:hypothetical protein
MIIGMSFTNFLFFMAIGNPRWPPPQYIETFLLTLVPIGPVVSEKKLETTDAK